MMNLCPSCGSELPASARFCPRCGVELGAEGAVVEKTERKPRFREPVKTPETPPRARLATRDIAPVVQAEASEPIEVTDGEWIRMTEEVFPIAWMAMLLAVCYIGVYFAVEALPGRNLLPGPGWLN
jgi:hypothetical protein